jgi:hypothetical protein
MPMIPGSRWVRVRAARLALHHSSQDLTNRAVGLEEIWRLNDLGVEACERAQRRE